MGEVKIALAMIAKDKASIIRRALDSTKSVFDLYVLQDTGSKDDTVKVFRDWCKKNSKTYIVNEKYVGKDYKQVVVDGKYTLADFAKARNDSFDLITQYEKANKTAFDYVFWMDTDDVIVGAEQIRALATQCSQNGVDQVILTYDYAPAVDGLKPVTQERERLISLKKPGQWVNRVHENYRFKDPTNILFPKQLEQAGIFIKLVHERTSFESIATNRRNHLIMMAQLGEEGMDKFPDDMLSHLAFDHWEHQEFAKAIENYEILIQRYSKVQTAPELMFQVSLKLAQAYLRTRIFDNAAKYAYRAIASMPQVADGYLLLAEIFSDARNWDEAEYYANKVLQMGRPNTTAPINEYDYIVTPRRIIMQVAIARNDIVKAKATAAELTKILPSNPQAKNEYFNLSREQQRQKAIVAIGELTTYIQENNLTDYIEKLKQAIPLALKDDDIVRAKLKELSYDYSHKGLIHKFEPTYQKTIIIYAGQGYEHWDGNSDIVKGIGGSEGMCIQMSRELAKLGNKVFVYNDCGMSDGKEFDGVTYIAYHKWNPNIKSDIFISLRRPDVFNALIKATKTYLWLHDTEYGEVPLSLMQAPNKIIVLTDFHKEIIKLNQGVTNDNVFWVSRNGLNKFAIDYADKNASKRNPFQLIYASSYDRGLDRVLAMWPYIKEQVPEATLKIFYGWNTYDKMIEMNKQHNPQRAQYMQQYKSSIIDAISKLDGVQELGRVSQNDLYKMFAESSIWIYPTSFQEISCITAMTAQAMGAVPVCTPFAALNETVNGKFGVKVEIDKTVDAVVYLLRNQADLEKRREGMIKWAREQFDMATLAKEWNEYFNNN